MCTKQRELNDNLPRLQETLLGWIVGGELVNTRSTSNKRICNVATINLNEQLEKFWSIEETLSHNQETVYSPQEKQVEDFFLKTVRRDDKARYVVRLPIDESIKLGESESITIRRFLSTERKLNQQPALKED